MVIEDIYVDGKLVRIEAICSSNTDKPDNITLKPVEIESTGVFLVPHITGQPFICNEDSIIEYRYRFN